MSKRKAGVNDIIYELDNDDVEISSEDEAKEAKCKRLDTDLNAFCVDNKHDNQNKDILINLTEEEIDTTPNSVSTCNGGKTSPAEIPSGNNSASIFETDEADSGKLLNNDGNKTTLFHEDIIVDSPTSNSDLGVVGCENRTPLISVRFKDKKLAASYKRKIKTFMLNLIKLHENNSSELDSETDIELDIWPEDLNEDDYENDDNTEQDGLFFVDTAPCSSADEVPTYTQVSTLISNNPIKEPSPPPTLRRTPLCFNCDGPHQLRECRMPRNNTRIAEKRKNMTRVGRYHIEDEQKYGHLIPGRISGKLRHALGLKRHEHPLYIYKMRMLGYPPGWLEEARISHSGITMFDSSGTAIQDPEEEEGEVCEPGSRDKFDIKKILDFPGFNVPASSRYKEEAHLLGLPPMSEQDSKIAMLQMLAPNAMKAYKRKKLTLFPSSENNTATQETAEMDLDSGEEAAEFPSVPPLPDEAPPPLPVAPPPPPSTPPPESPPPAPPGIEDEITETSKQETESADEKSADDIEVIEVMKVKDIPVPQPVMITIDDDEDKSQVSSGRDSPTLDDLEEKKLALLNALKGEVGLKDNLSINSEIENDGNNTANDEHILDECSKAPNDESNSQNESDKEKTEPSNIVNEETVVAEGIPVNETNTISDSQCNLSTPENKTGSVKTTSYGTPVMNIASSYVKLPSDDKFAKDICDVINFENLPNSTGKYKKICSLLKKVKSEVDRIQES
ncbi:unnamed protein product [Chilo suppressalis]|uniref:PSP proline-rich domain-containing protein n=1 Tax=Chilo suppressalis TaxID=168631 RepID=A0ABN8L7I8_CHISP|nr:unnamed protein product [Chilo suppressalis]